MSEVSDRVHEMSLFAAREFAAKFDREMGSPSPPLIAERMKFGYEMGYLRGHADGIRDAMKMFEETLRTPEVREEKGDDDASSK